MERKPKYTLLEAKQKIEAFCAYQERCDQEIRKKLQSWNLYTEDIDIIISDLIANNFLNEERFAEAYVSGKFRIKKWGRIKIKQHLKQKGISEYSINKAIEQILEEEYMETLKELYLTKLKSISKGNHLERRAKIQRYLVGKGYEHSLIISTLDNNSHP